MVSIAFLQQETCWPGQRLAKRAKEGNEEAKSNSDSLRMEPAPPIPASAIKSNSNQCRNGLEQGMKDTVEALREPAEAANINCMSVQAANSPHVIVKIKVQKYPSTTKSL